MQQQHARRCPSCHKPPFIYVEKGYNLKYKVVVECPPCNNITTGDNRDLAVEQWNKQFALALGGRA